MAANTVQLLHCICTVQKLLSLCAQYLHYVRRMIALSLSRQQAVRRVHARHRLALHGGAHAASSSRLASSSRSPREPRASDCAQNNHRCRCPGSLTCRCGVVQPDIFVEVFDVDEDPGQMRNLVNETSAADLAYYRAEIRRQFACAGASCK